MSRPIQRLRALIGWMHEDEAALTLAGRPKEAAPSAAHVERARKKRLVAAARGAPGNRLSVLKPLPRSLQQYGAELVLTRAGGNLADSGFQPALVDLRGVCAMAPLARVDLDLPAVDAGDLLGLAKVTLPVAAGAPADVDYDRETSAWIIDPGLEVLGEFDRPGAGEFVVGLVVGPAPSFVQVVKAGDRFVLTDGYDTAITLLARGIHEVPAFVKAYGATMDLEFGPTQLERGIVFGRRPPLLPDFLDDDVAAEVVMPATRRILMVRAVEITHFRSAADARGNLPAQQDLGCF